MRPTHAVVVDAAHGREAPRPNSDFRHLDDGSLAYLLGRKHVEIDTWTRVRLGAAAIRVTLRGVAYHGVRTATNATTFHRHDHRRGTHTQISDAHVQLSHNLAFTGQYIGDTDTTTYI